MSICIYICTYREIQPRGPWQEKGSQVRGFHKNAARMWKVEILECHSEFETLIRNLNIMLLVEKIRQAPVEGKVVYPIFDRVFDIPGGAGFFSITSMN